MRAAEGKNDRAHLRAEGYIVEEGTGRVIRVAPWVIKEQKKSLYSGLVGFLKSKSDGLKHVESWLEMCWGKMPHNMQMLDNQVVWMQVSSPGEVEEILFSQPLETLHPISQCWRDGWKSCDPHQILLGLRSKGCLSRRGMKEFLGS